MTVVAIYKQSFSIILIVALISGQGVVMMWSVWMNFGVAQAWDYVRIYF